MDKNLYLKTLQALFHAHGLDIKDVRGFGTNGAASMLVEYRGLRSRVAEINPLAKSVHCV